MLDKNNFCNIQRVEAFDIFTDSSNFYLKKMPISLNMMARKCTIEEVAEKKRKEEVSAMSEDIKQFL
jgi:hypothetical protein